MGLAIDGNVVHGIAKGGQAFISTDQAEWAFTDHCSVLSLAPDTDGQNYGVTVISFTRPPSEFDGKQVFILYYYTYLSGFDSNSTFFIVTTGAFEFNSTANMDVETLTGDGTLHLKWISNNLFMTVDSEMKEDRVRKNPVGIIVELRN